MSFWDIFYCVYDIAAVLIAAATLLVISLVRQKKAKKTVEGFLRSPKKLGDLSYSEYEDIAFAGFALGKTPRDIEEEKEMFTRAHIYIRALPPHYRVLVRSDPPEPSPVGADKWCEKCAKAGRCGSYRIGTFCGGNDFEEKKEEKT